MGDMEKVIFIQKQLIKHESANFSAVRKMTEEDLGKRTAGVDKNSLLTPDERMESVRNIHVDEKLDKVLRVTIPEPNGSVRNLGVPTMRDRAEQCLVEFALEPQYSYEAISAPKGLRVSTRDVLVSKERLRCKEISGKPFRPFTVHRGGRQTIRHTRHLRPAPSRRHGSHLDQKNRTMLLLCS